METKTIAKTMGTRTMRRATIKATTATPGAAVMAAAAAAEATTKRKAAVTMITTRIKTVTRTTGKRMIATVIDVERPNRLGLF